MYVSLMGNMKQACSLMDVLYGSMLFECSSKSKAIPIYLAQSSFAEDKKSC